MNDQTRTEPHNIAIGIHAARARCETDSMDEIEVPVDRYSGGPDAARPRPFLDRRRPDAERGSITPTVT